MFKLSVCITHVAMALTLLPSISHAAEEEEEEEDRRQREGLEIETVKPAQRKCQKMQKNKG